MGTGADRGDIEGRLRECAESFLAWRYEQEVAITTELADLLVEAAEAIGEARRAMRALLVIAGAQDKLLAAYRIGRRPGDKALDAMKGRDSALADAATALARLEGGDRGDEQIGMDEG